MEKFYIVTDFEESYKKEKIYENKEIALLNKAVEIMGSEYSIKPSSGFLTDAETKKTEYTLIERYNNQFNNLNKKVYLLCIDSTNLEKCHVLEFKEIYNLYEYLKCNENFKLVYNNELQEKSWLNVPSFNIDIIQKYFLDNLDKPKKIRIENINILKKLYPDAYDIIKKLESFIFRMPQEDARKFLTEELKEDNYNLHDSIKSQEKTHGSFARRLVLRIKDK